MGEMVENLAKNFACLEIDEKCGGGRAEQLVLDIIQCIDNTDRHSETGLIPLLQNDVIQQLKTLLLADNLKLKECLAKLVAELAKQENARGTCVELVPDLLKLLPSTNIPVLIQACRALGNICFDNDSGRQCVDEHSGIPLLIDLLKRHLATSGEEADRLKVVACGFLLNLTNSTETVQDKAILHNGVEILNAYLQKHNDDDNICQMALLALGCLTESELGKSKLSECPVAVTVGELLGTETGEELLDVIFELLTNMAETDCVKLQLVNSSVIDKILDLIKANESIEDEESLTVIKMATDLFPTLLHADVSMEALFQDGKSRLYRESIGWLKSPNQLLQIAGALTIGNFAIKDSKCSFLVKEGLHEKLLDVLDSTNSCGENNPALQHAVFSSLRNLSIPAQNKVTLFKSGVLGRILPYVFKAQLTPVQFKMLGTFRLLVDGQKDIATSLGKNTEFVREVISWCQVESHPGVKAEASRLIAWLIKHSRSGDVMSVIVEHGGLPDLCNMMHSEHAVMQNEALVALTLIATTILEKATQSLMDSDLVPAIKVLLTDDSTLTEILSNALTLILVLSKSSQIKDLMKMADFAELCKEFSQSHEDNAFKGQAKNAYSVLK